VGKDAQARGCAAFLDETSAMYSAIKSHMSGSAVAEGVFGSNRSNATICLRDV